MRYKKQECEKLDNFSRRTPEERIKYDERVEYLKNKEELEIDEEPHFLPLFMKSLNSSSYNTYNIKNDWDSIDPNTALGLLQSNNSLYSSVPNKVIREHAVAKINT